VEIARDPRQLPDGVEAGLLVPYEITVLPDGLLEDVAGILLQLLRRMKKRRLIPGYSSPDTGIVPFRSIGRAKIALAVFISSPLPG